MAEELIPHGLGQGLGPLGVVHPEAVLGQDLHPRHDQDGHRHDPDVLAQVGKAAEAVHQGLHIGRETGLLPAQGVIHRHADDLGADHVRQGSHRRGQHADDEKQLAALEKAPQQLPLEAFFFFCLLFRFGFHDFTLKIVVFQPQNPV